MEGEVLKQIQDKTNKLFCSLLYLQWKRDFEFLQ